jgi:hypothetical protein
MAQMFTTVAQVNRYMGNNADPLANAQEIGGLISRVSDIILNQYLNRSSILTRSFTQVLSGSGTSRVFLREYPVTAVSAVSILGRTIAAAPADQSAQGYILEPWDGVPPGTSQSIALLGCGFPKGMSNISVTYQAGYAVFNEPVTIMPNSPVVALPAQPYGIWGADIGVSYADGRPLVAVKKTPHQGQYVPPDPFSLDNPHEDYLFNTRDIGQNMLLSYAYIPGTIQEAVCEVVAERLTYRQRIGMQSKSLAGQETVSFSLKDLPDFVKASLYPYKNINIFS